MVRKRLFDRLDASHIFDAPLSSQKRPLFTFQRQHPVRTFKLHVCFAFGVYWRSRAGQQFPIRRWKRRPFDALRNRMRHDTGVSIMVSGCPGFVARATRGIVRGVEVTNRQRTSYFGHEKARVGRGGSDAAVVVIRKGRTPDGGTAPVGLVGAQARGGRASA